MFSRIQNKTSVKTVGRKILRPTVFLVVLVFLCLVFFIPAYGDISDDFLRKGQERMRDKDYAGAIVYFESAHKSGPYNKIIHKNLSIAYHNLAVLNAQAGELENAIRNELQALRFDPESSIIKEQLSVFYNNLALKNADSGNYKPAQENMRKALEFSPDSEQLKKNLYNILLKYADYQHSRKNDQPAIRTAKEAIKTLPGDAQGYIFLGNIYYKQDNFTEALKYWQDALRIDPANAGLKDRIESLKREKIVERDFDTERKTFFRIRFDRELDSRYVGRISDILDDARRSLRNQFGFYSDEVIPVIIYDDAQFEQATAQPDWTQGLYDGKIRLKYQDISRDDAILRRVLFHEYAHAMVFFNVGLNIPIWLNEGFSQFNEPDTDFTSADKIFLSGYIKSHGRFSLEGLDCMFSQKENQDTIRAAYLESKLFFLYLVDKYTKYRIKRLFEELKRGKQWQKAFTEVYRVSIDRMERNFNNYLDDLLK